jgi:GNAT superfamily N-acetyltransferase
MVTDMTAQVRVEIHPADPADLPSLVDSLGQEHYFIDRLKRHQDGHGVLLIAWCVDVPVGDVYLWRAAKAEEELNRWFPDAPLLTHLEVRRDLRNRGIGSQLLRYAEEELARDGCGQVVLGVGRENKDARRLYERTGYQLYLDRGAEAEISTAKEEWDAGGSRREEQETCLVYVKDLGNR